MLSLKGIEVKKEKRWNHSNMLTGLSTRVSLNVKYQGGESTGKLVYWQWERSQSSIDSRFPHVKKNLQIV